MGTLNKLFSTLYVKKLNRLHFTYGEIYFLTIIVGGHNNVFTNILTLLNEIE